MENPKINGTLILRAHNFIITEEKNEKETRTTQVNVCTIFMFTKRRNLTLEKTKQKNLQVPSKTKCLRARRRLRGEPR